MANTHSLDLESGSSQYAYITDALQTGLDITGTISGEAWVKFESITGTYSIINKGGANAATGGYHFFFNGADDKLTLDWYSGTAAQFSRIYIPFNPTAGVWYHVAFTVTPSSASGGKMYINGSPFTVTVDSSSAASIQNNSARFEIGVHDSASLDDGPSGYFDGLIDDVRIWDDIRTDTEILDNMCKELEGDEANLKGYWKFDNSPDDGTINNNYLTLSGSPSYSTDVPFTDAVIFTPIIIQF